MAYDIARGATFIYVNYHTELEFADAVDWLSHGEDGTRRVDVVVHSNSFLTGPFDGTSEPARAVDRARAAGILWVNSAGNYAGRHWAGDAGDAGRDGFADIGQGGAIPFSLPPGTSMGATLSWRGCARGVTAVPAQSASFEVVVTDGSAVPSCSRAAGAMPRARCRAEHCRRRGAHLCVPRAAGGRLAALRVRAVRAGSGPAGATPCRPRACRRPGDAAGAFAVGAADWRDDSLADYSSQGPTDDGRLKPELVGARVDGRLARHRDGRHIGERAAVPPLRRC